VGLVVLQDVQEVQEVQVVLVNPVQVGLVVVRVVQGVCFHHRFRQSY